MVSDGHRDIVSDKPKRIARDIEEHDFSDLQSRGSSTAAHACGPIPSRLQGEGGLAPVRGDLGLEWAHRVSARGLVRVLRTRPTTGDSDQFRRLAIRVTRLVRALRRRHR